MFLESSRDEAILGAQNRSWGVQNRSLEGPWGVPGGPKPVPGGSLGSPWGVPGGPGGLPEGSRESGRPPERSKGFPEEHLGVILEEFEGDLGVIFASKIDAKCM